MVDITSDESVARLRDDVRRFLKSQGSVARLVGLVNNAGGLLSSGPVEWTDVSVDVAQMNLNFVGTVRVTKAFLSLLRESGEGRVVNVSSILGLVASPLGAAYAASKFALEGWSDALRREMLPFGVRVSIIEPGMFRGTDFYKRYTIPVSESWSKLDDSVKDAYGGPYKDYVISRLINIYAALGSPEPQKVVNVMYDALFNPAPHRRYRCGFDCVVLARILEWVPTCIADLSLTVADVAITWNATMLPRMPAKGMSKSWTGIIRFALLGYSISRCMFLSSGIFVLLVYVLFIY